MPFEQSNTIGVESDAEAPLPVAAVAVEPDDREAEAEIATANKDHNQNQTVISNLLPKILSNSQHGNAATVPIKQLLDSNSSLEDGCPTGLKTRVPFSSGKAPP